VVVDLVEIKDNKINSALIFAIGISLPIPFFRLSFLNFEIPIYLLLFLIYFAINFPVIIKNKVSKQLLMSLLLIIITILTTSLININKFDLNIALILKYILNVFFVLMLSLINLSSSNIKKILKYSLISITIFLLISIYLYVVINNKDYIGIDFINFTRNGRNSIAFYLGTFFIISFFVFENKVVKFIIPIIMIASVFLLQSRGLIVSISFVSIILIIMLLINKKNKFKWSRLLYIFLILSATTVLISYFSDINIVIDRIKTINIFDSRYDDISSNLSRKELNQKAFEVIKQYPLSGIGLGNFSNYNLSLSGTDSRGTHNDYLGLLTEFGFVGIIIIATLFVKFLIPAIRYVISYKSPNKNNLYIFSLITIYFFVYMLFINVMNTPFFWFFLALYSFERNKTKDLTQTDLLI